MFDTKLKPLYKEVTFWVLLAISLPGIVALYLGAWTQIHTTGSFDPQAFYAGVFALPVVVYLGIARQYVRGKAVEAGPMMNQDALLLESNPPEGDYDEFTPVNIGGDLDDDEILIDHSGGQ